MGLDEIFPKVVRKQANIETLNVDVLLSVDQSSSVVEAVEQLGSSKRIGGPGIIKGQSTNSFVGGIDGLGCDGQGKMKSYITRQIQPMIKIF